MGKCKTYILALGLFVFLSLQLVAQDSLRIQGGVFHNKTKLTTVDVNIYINNDVFQSIELRGKNVIRTRLPLEEIVTLEISAPGYYTKRVMIDTHIPKRKKKPRLFYEFDIDLYSIDEMKGVNTSSLDFPIGLVKYKKNKFQENRKYTKNKKNEHIYMLEESESILEKKKGRK